jgi:hypothetical protein
MSISVDVVDMLLEHPRIFDFSHRPLKSICHPFGFGRTVSFLRKDSLALVVPRPDDDVSHAWKSAGKLMTRCANSSVMSNARKAVMSDAALQTVLLRWWHMSSGYAMALPAEIPPAAFLYTYAFVFKSLSGRADRAMDASDCGWTDYVSEFRSGDASKAGCGITIAHFARFLLELTDNVTLSVNPSEWVSFLEKLLDRAESIDLATWIDVQSAQGSEHSFITLNRVVETVERALQVPEPSFALSPTCPGNMEVPQLKVSMLPIALEESCETHDRNTSSLHHEDASGMEMFFTLAADLLERKEQFEQSVRNASTRRLRESRSRQKSCLKTIPEEFTFQSTSRARLNGPSEFSSVAACLAPLDGDDRDDSEDLTNESEDSVVADFDDTRMPLAPSNYDTIPPKQTVDEESDRLKHMLSALHFRDDHGSPNGLLHSPSCPSDRSKMAEMHLALLSKKLDREHEIPMNTNLPAISSRGRMQDSSRSPSSSTSPRSRESVRLPLLPTSPPHSPAAPSKRRDGSTTSRF